MKKNYLLFLKIWSLVIIITGILWYWYQGSLRQRPPIVIHSVSEVESLYIHTAPSQLNTPETVNLSNPLLKYCNIPTLDNFAGDEGNFDDKYELLGVITIFRHGDRGPLTVTTTTDRQNINCSSFVTKRYKDLEGVIRNYKSQPLLQKLLPKDDYCKPGLLSKQGSSQLIELGHGFKKSYQSYFNFSHPLAAKHITTYSTSYSRTIQSLYSFMFGLVGSDSYLKVTPHSNADVPFCFKHCRCEAASRLEKLHKKELNSRLKANYDWGNFSSLVKSVLQESDDRKMILPSTVKDITLNYVCHNYTPPCIADRYCFRSAFMNPLDKYLQYEAEASANGLNLKKASILRAYGLLNNIDQQIQSWITLEKKQHSSSGGSKLPQFLFFSGHDLTLMNVLSALSLYDGYLPYYASRLTIELLADNGQYYTRLLWNGVDVSRRTCSTSRQEFCSARFLHKLLTNEMKRNFQTDKFSEACEV